MGGELNYPIPEADSKDTDGRTLLSWAAERGHETVVRLLRSYGADSIAFF
jgi:ankyrin repeat protein